MQRLKTDYLDLYLLHWRGTVPLVETLATFQALRKSAKIRDYGVSNFDAHDMEEAILLPGGDEIVTDQVLYNLVNRGIEWDLLPWCRERGIVIMAYSPIEHASDGRSALLTSRVLKRIAAHRDATPAQIALAWLLQQNVVVIPKASNLEHVRENRGALEITLTEKDLKELDLAFPPPRRKVPLAMR